MEYKVDGPFEIPTIKEKGGKLIDEDTIRDLWGDGWGTYSNGKGCYVFAMQAAGGFLPTYIGQAKKGFRQECFTDDKLKKLYKAFQKRIRGIPVIFFVSRVGGKGPIKKKEVDEIEKPLIALGYDKNPKLENSRGLAVPSWSIKGVVRSKKGQSSKAARDFKQTFNL